MTTATVTNISKTPLYGAALLPPRFSYFISANAQLRSRSRELVVAHHEHRAACVGVRCALQRDPVTGEPIRKRLATIRRALGALIECRDDLRSKRADRR